MNRDSDSDNGFRLPVISESSFVRKAILSEYDQSYKKSSPNQISVQFLFKPKLENVEISSYLYRFD